LHTISNDRSSTILFPLPFEFLRAFGGTEQKP
jgi:hypothetical protein